MKNTSLLCDIGNTSIDFGIFEEEIKFHKKIVSKDIAAIHDFLDEIHSQVSFCLISSVNRTTTQTLVSLLDMYHLSYQLINPILMKDYAINNQYIITNTNYLGSDLYCDVIAVKKSPSIIIDLGTVGKVLFLDKEKNFKGAAIFPDIEQFPKMMDASTDLLKDYALDKKPPIVSLKTEECISSGAIHGMCGLLNGYISQIKKTYSLSKTDIYLTGGSAFYVKDILPQYGVKDLIYDDVLCLRGIGTLLQFIKNNI